MILAWLLACSEEPSATDPIVDDLDASETLPDDEQDEALDAGADLYGENCARCHGARGDGDVGLDRVSSDRLVAQILDGSEQQVYGSMPPFADVLDDEEIALVAEYVETVLWGRD